MPMNNNIYRNTSDEELLNAVYTPISTADYRTNIDNTFIDNMPIKDYIRKIIREEYFKTLKKKENHI